ncbi:MAG: TonB family protein [Gemmatimonadetes bacterium]|nr:TonB family protein [Gemmatimonadota bacterium]
MFNTLIASKPARKGFLNSRNVLASAGIHAALLGGAVYAMANAPERKAADPEEQVTYMDVQKPEQPPVVETPPPPPPPAVEEPQPQPEQPAVLEKPVAEPAQVKADEPAPTPEEPIAKGFQTLEPPATPPASIPAVDPNAKPVSVEDFSGVGVAGGVASGVEGGQARNAAKDPPSGDDDASKASSGPVDVAVVEERPKLQNGDEMQRVLERLYPPLLRDAGVTGQTVLQFVIDTEGRVESSSVEVVSATNDAFREASVKAAEKFRFRPAKIGGRNVRVAITMPISWTLDKA